MSLLPAPESDEWLAGELEVQLLAARLGHVCHIGGSRHGRAVLYLSTPMHELAVCDGCARSKFPALYAKARTQGFRRP